MKKALGIVLLVIGIVLIAIPLYMEWEGKKESRALEEAMALIMESDGDPVDLSEIENLPFDEEEITKTMTLEIPAIHLEQPILAETTEENLNVALTQIKENQDPEKGNFTIAGHRGYRSGRYFNDLSKVDLGEEILLHVGNQTYVYEVTSSEVIEPTHVEVLDDDPNKNEITMITCTVTGKYRVAVKGEFKEKRQKE